MSSTSENVDRLSTLPEDILSNVLSRMPMKFAVRTSILSKRWRYSWMYVTNLDFDDHIHPIHGLDSLTKFVDRVLKFLKSSEINLFRLHFSVIWVRMTSVSNWIDEAVRLNVRELDIYAILVQLPSSLFTCKTLTKLRLHRSVYDYGVWEFSCSVNLPCLKTLDIAIFENPFVNAFKLIHGCPMLESLSLEVTWRNDEEDYIFNIPTLKRLKVTWLKCAYLINKVVLNVPNLEYLFVGGVLCSAFVMEDVSSLVEAHVSFREIRFYNLWFELLKGINGVKSFSAENQTSLIDFKILFNSPLPIFANLKRLELKGFWHYGQIPEILESCPELEHLCIGKLEDESCWIEPKSVPACMLTNLTTIKFSLCNRRKCDIKFLEYMSENAGVLKTVTILCESLCMEEEMQLCAQLLKFLRASSYCEIHFHGNWFQCTIRGRLIHRISTKLNGIKI